MRGGVQGGCGGRAGGCLGAFAGAAEHVCVSVSPSASLVLLWPPWLSGALYVACR